MLLIPENQQLHIPTTTTTATEDLNNHDPTTITMNHQPLNMFQDNYDDVDSTCSTPYVSAPSSPGRGHSAPVTGFYYSAPASPMHFMIMSKANSGNNNNLVSSQQPEASPASSSSCSFEFDFSATKTSTNGSSSAGSMSSADELFLNGQIRPMKLSSHLQRPQALAPLLDLDEADEGVDGEIFRGRDSKVRDRSLRRRTRSMSPLRTTAPLGGWYDDGDSFQDNGILGENQDMAYKNEGGGEEEEEAVLSGETTTSESGASSRSSSVGRSSKRWIFLKEFLYRSKSEGRNYGHKFWGSLSFSPVKEKIKMDKSSKFPTIKKSTFSPDLSATESGGVSDGKKGKQTVQKDVKKKTIVNGIGKRRVPPSPHELHYTANRAQAEEMRKKTFLPYKQGLLGCLGFSSKSYGAINGFARALNPVSSR